LADRIEGELLGPGWDWDDDRTPGLLARTAVAVVRPHLARLTDQAQKARARLAEIGETREEFGVRTYDNDEDVEVMSTQEQARDLAEAWRREIAGSNPTLMARTRQCKPGQWREVADDGA
jgi:hypothetical protein